MIDRGRERVCVLGGGVGEERDSGGGWQGGRERERERERERGREGERGPREGEEYFFRFKNAVAMTTS